MAQRDYAARGGSKKKKSGKISPMLMIVALIVVFGFAFGLYFMKASSDQQPEQPVAKVEKAKPKSQLPSRPEETWSYIKELESRTVPTTDDALANSAQLNEKQKEALKRLEEAEKLKAEQAAKVAAEQTQSTTAEEAKSTTTSDEEKLAAQKAADEKAAEEKKQAEQRRKAELAKQEAAKKAEAEKNAKSDTAKTDTAKSEAEKNKKPDNAKAGKYGLQCGAFNDRGKAEALQGKLAMIGLNARISESGKWHRVVVGPVGDRSAASQAQQQATPVERCVIIGM